MGNPRQHDRDKDAHRLSGGNDRKFTIIRQVEMIVILLFIFRNDFETKSQGF